MTLYLIGVGVSLCFTVVRYAHAVLVRTFSTYHLNLRKIGVRLSFIPGVSWTRTGEWREELPVALFFSAVLVALSWIGVVLPLIEGVASWWKRMTMPPRLKEIDWRMHNVDLDAAEVERLDFEIIELTLGAEAAARVRADLAEWKSARANR
ncbi:hypothetical protein [Myxococcus sp. NMCA1]|uniref:hypothetical protein n=1 Tax=Myxococcus sp. NMCA1 TaxID=2996785 RepID=UPI0022858650|nr:hypothetical protein [Myxococcus sp. NMCA1]WAM23789.1 hypothetical protein OZ403_24940 [Myxococcus sp. NMCA1]